MINFISYISQKMSTPHTQKLQNIYIFATMQFIYMISSRISCMATMIYPLGQKVYGKHSDSHILILDT